jgi:cell division protein FtsQ
VKRKKILARQAVTKKKTERLSRLRPIFRAFSALFLKGTFLLAVLAVMSLAFLSLYGYLLTSSYIRLEEVVVSGVDEDLKGELLEMAHLNYEHSLLAIDLKEVQERLEKHPWVRSVNLEKNFPHTLVIRVEKEEPLALALTDKLFYMDRRGRLFKEPSPDERVDFPVVTGLCEKGKERQEQIDVAVRVLRLFEGGEPPWDLSHLAEVHVKQDGAVELYVSFIPGVVKVRVCDMATKLDELKDVVNHLVSTGRIHMVRIIDLGYADGAAVAFEKG